MTTVVPTSEEDPALSVLRFTAEMSWAEAGPEVAEPQVTSLCMEAQECMISGRWFDLASLMITSADLVFSKASEKDLECIFTVICNLVKKPESLDESLEISKLLSTKIAQQPNEKPALKLKILFNLYNMLENPSGRFLVYMKALNVAANVNIIPSFKKIDTLLKEWNLELQDQRQLFLAISNILKEHKSLGLVHEDCMTKMRLMTIVDLASNESGIISYLSIKNTLQIEDDDVEPWVVKAITAKLIDCKIDQMNQVIIVSQYSERVFGVSQWEALRTKLTSWRGNIANVITTIQANKVTEEGTQSMQGLMVR
ncbi:hypothetical protein L2E82_11236 [Cichorium intybus]|uniref:Uncharacterized protein n=1 Tax=Cichorium intybus TaxID=13427 RepID=A0ACB9GER6_CICIN|nr:hypothetical protein L2E82_11236 [Cichorium intybus]